MKLYNTLSRQKEEFVPAGDEVTLYVCGITSYDYSHIGHAMSTIAFEVLHRYLEYRGHKVRRIQNFTDVDDKIINRSAKDGVSSEEIAQTYIDAFYEDMDALNVMRATVYPRATNEIPQIIEIIAGLIESENAYEAEGSVYYSVRSNPEYGKLSHRSVDELLEGTRFDSEEGKHDPADFALWKLSKPGEPAWDSPWSMGRPGWHIECSAMANHHLGRTIDIHGGGLDLIFPHHENEVAQSESYLGGEQFARFWLHNGMLRLSGEKMSKSIGNIIRVRDAVAKNSPDAIRLWMYSSNYRSPLTYDEVGIAAAERAAQRLRNVIATVSQPGASSELDTSEFKTRFIDSMDDDLNVPRAVAALFDLVRMINRSRDAGEKIEGAIEVLTELSGVLGLSLVAAQTRSDALSDGEIDDLIEQRRAARSEKRYSDADAIRAQLDEMGIAIADSTERTTWYRL